MWEISGAAAGLGVGCGCGVRRGVRLWGAAAGLGAGLQPLPGNNARL